MDVTGNGPASKREHPHGLKPKGGSMMTKHGFTMTQLVNYRASATSAIRRSFEQRGAVEVRTPVFSTCPDLAPVPQFVCKHPLSDAAYCLRIAPEEHLTRLIGLGVPAVYEIATNF